MQGKGTRLETGKWVCRSGEGSGRAAGLSRLPGAGTAVCARRRALLLLAKGLAGLAGEEGGARGGGWAGAGPRQ